MPKFHKVQTELETSYFFHCPGCNYAHSVRAVGMEPRWNVSGIEEDKPTVSPSILCNGIPQAKAAGLVRCHSFVKDGNIQFLADCDHALAGQTVEIPDFD